MARFNVSGQVFGLNTKPIKNAKIRIIDADLGSSDDLIYRGRTDGEGVFRGRTTKDWKDENWLDGPFGSRIPTPDIMMLEFKIQKDSNSHTGPFVLLPGGSSAPIVCPWNDPIVFGTVDGTDCFSASEMAAKILESADSSSSVNITVYDPATRAALAPLTGTEDELRRFIKDSTPLGQLPFLRPHSILTPNSRLTSNAADPVTILAGTALILLAISVIIAAAGASAAAIILVSSIYKAMDQCSDIEVESEGPTGNLDTSNGDGTSGGGSTKVKLGGCTSST